jgi:hypothetical protein
MGLFHLANTTEGGRIFSDDLLDTRVEIDIIMEEINRELSRTVVF